MVVLISEDLVSVLVLVSNGQVSVLVSVSDFKAETPSLIVMLGETLWSPAVQPNDDASQTDISSYLCAISVQGLEKINKYISF